MPAGLVLLRQRRCSRVPMRAMPSASVSGGPDPPPKRRPNRWIQRFCWSQCPCGRPVNRGHPVSRGRPINLLQKHYSPCGRPASSSARSQLQPAVHVHAYPKLLARCMAARTGHRKVNERCELRITTIGLCTPVQFNSPIASSGEAGVAEETMIVVCLDLERRRARVIELSIEVPLRERVPFLSPRVDTVGHVGLLTGGKGCTERGRVVVIVNSAGRLQVAEDGCCRRDNGRSGRSR